MLYQVTLGVIVVAIFSFGFSASFFYGILSKQELAITRKRADARRGNVFFVLGVILAVAEPSLILFALGLEGVGVLATGLWLLFTLFIIRSNR